MQKSKLVSVIIPVHNRIPLFIKCLRSVASQNYNNIQIIVVDDCSNSDIKKYSKGVKLVTNKINLGPAKSRNIGIKNATGEYFIFLDSDDILRPDFVSKLVQTIELSEFNIYTVFMKPNFIDHFRFFYLLLSIIRNLCFYVSYIFNKGELLKSFFYMTRLSGMIFSRNAIKGIEFDTSYKSAEDWKFVWECIDKNNSRIGILPNLLANFTYHNDSLTLGRSNYFKSYTSLLSSLPPSLKESFGIKLFQMYTSYVNNSK